MKALYWRSIVFGLGVDLAIGVGFWYFTKTEYSDSKEVIFIIIGLLWAARIILWAKDAVVQFLLQWATDNEFMTNLVLRDLRERKIPAPTRGDLKTIQFLADFADRDFEDGDERVRCALIYANYTTTLQNVNFWRTIAFESAIDAAMKRYAEEQPDRD